MSLLSRVKPACGWLFVLVISVVILTPMQNDMYVSSFPAMAHYFHVGNIELVLGIGLISMSAMQLFYGPFLDFYGRKPVMMVGLGIFIVGAFITATSTHFSMMLAGRTVQAAGACGLIAGTMAVLRDRFTKDEAVTYVAFVFGIIAVVPLLSPLLGSYMQVEFGWRGGFMLMLVLGIFYLGVLSVALDDVGFQRPAGKLTVARAFGGYRELFQHKKYMAFTLSSGLSYAVIFAYIAGSSRLLMTLLHMSVIHYGWLFCLNAIAIITTAFGAPRAAKKLGLESMMIAGTVVMLVGAALFLAVALLAPQSLMLTVAAIFVMSFGVGLVRPTGSSGAVSSVDARIAGCASSLYSFFLFLGGAVTTSIVHYFLNNSDAPFALLLVGISGLAVLCAMPLRKLA